jgi:hypothetical protein
MSPSFQDTNHRQHIGVHAQLREASKSVIFTVGNFVKCSCNWRKVLRDCYIKMVFEEKEQCGADCNYLIRVRARMNPVMNRWVR